MNIGLVCVTETTPTQAMSKCSQPSPIMPLHHIRKAIYFLSGLLYFLYHPYIAHLLISRMFSWAGIACHTSWLKCCLCLSVCLSVWMLTSMAQIITTTDRVYLYSCTHTPTNELQSQTKKLGQTDLLYLPKSHSKGNRTSICIVLLRGPPTPKALRYGQIARGSHSFTCHPHKPYLPLLCKHSPDGATSTGVADI